MTHYQAPLRDIRFALFELLDYERHCTTVTNTDISLDADLIQAFLMEVARFAEEVKLYWAAKCSVLAGRYCNPCDKRSISSAYSMKMMRNSFHS